MSDRARISRERLREAGLRPTRQRLALAGLLFAGGDRHVTAQMLHGEAKAAGVAVSLATVYNTLHEFTAAGLLREVAAGPDRIHFDTNTAPHHHFFDIVSGELTDIPHDSIAVGALPAPPAGAVVDAVDVVIRVTPAGGRPARRATNFSTFVS